MNTRILTKIVIVEWRFSLTDTYQLDQSSPVGASSGQSYMNKRVQQADKIDDFGPEVVVGQFVHSSVRPSGGWSVGHLVL